MAEFKRQPICEVCKKNEAITFSHLKKDASTGKDQWKFCCSCTSDRQKYYIPIKNFFSQAPATVDWLAHMHQKAWMDWRDFMAMRMRFRHATDSYNVP